EGSRGHAHRRRSLALHPGARCRSTAAGGAGRRERHRSDGSARWSPRCRPLRGIRSRRGAPRPSPTGDTAVMQARDIQPSSSSSVRRLVAGILQWLDAVPYTALAIPLRLAMATVFWNSAMTKLANWDTAVALFVDEYKLPFVPPEIAAYIAASIELTTPV